MNNIGKFTTSLTLAVVVTAILAVLFRAPYLTFLVLSVVCFTGFLYYLMLGDDKNDPDASV